MNHTDDRGYPRFGSHYLPRTRTGRITVIAFLVLMALAEPPIVFAFANRVEPWLLGMPFLYAWLLFVYIGLIAVLIVALRRGL